MDCSGMSVPRRVLLLQILLASLLFLLSCQELRASSIPARRVRRLAEPESHWGAKDTYRNLMQYGNVLEPESHWGARDTYRNLMQYGNATTTQEWPWIAALYKKKLNNSTFVDSAFKCGGVLISKQHVLTAAHCVFNTASHTQLLADGFFLALGMYNVLDHGEHNKQVFRIVRAIPHPNYNGSVGSDHDIAVILLDGEALENTFVRPVLLWDLTTNPTTCSGTTVGWGMDEHGNPTTETPTRVLMNSTTNRACRASDPTLHILATDVTFCALGLRYDSGPCSGDSGSGIFFPTRVENSQERWMVRGLVSKGLTRREQIEGREYDVCDLTKHVVFTDLLAVSDWIHSTTNITSRRGYPLHLSGQQMWQCSAGWKSNPRIRELTLISQQERGRKLLESSERGDVKMVRLLVRAGVELSEINDEGRTALHLAAQAGHAEVVQKLLRAGANLSVTDQDTNTPLHLAALSGHVQVIRLLDHGATLLNLPGHSNFTALHWAALGGHDAVVQLLMNHSADCESRAVDGYTPLHMAAYKGLTSTVRLLVARHCEKNSKNTYGRSPLHRASYNGHEETVRALVELGAHIDIQDNRYNTPLHDAVRGNVIDTVRALVDLGAQLSVNDIDSVTPLRQARRWGYTDIAEFLESRGATVRSPNRPGLLEFERLRKRQ